MKRAITLAATLAFLAAACGNNGNIGPASEEEGRSHAPPGEPTAADDAGGESNDPFSPASDPAPSDPAPSDPAPSDPAPSDPAPSDAGSAPAPSDAGSAPAPSDAGASAPPPSDAGSAPASDTAASAPPPSDAGSAIDAAPAPPPVIDPVPPPPPVVQPAPTQRLVAYWATWTRAQMPPKSIQWSKFTHLAHAFVLPSSTGGLKNVSTYVDPELIAEAHAHGVKVVASVGGWGANFDANVDPVMRAKTVAQLVSLCKNNGYDGIDVDWEFPTATTGAAWAAMIAELRAGLDAVRPGLELGAAISASREHMQNLPKSGLSKLSFIGVMTYDFAGSWSASIGHHSPLFRNKGGDPGSTADAISYLTDTVGLPADKLLFGLPFYGYAFQGSTLAGTPVGPTQNLDYAKIAPMLSGQGYTRQFDGISKVPYLTRPSAPGFVSYEDATSVDGKCAWSKTMNLGGAIIWHLVGDKLSDGTQPLLTAAQACR